MTPTLATACAALPPAGANFSNGGPAKNCLLEMELIDERALSKLKWRCRRGLLENDLFIERFFKRYEGGLTLHQALGLTQLMELGDNDLLDLHLSRKELEDLPDAPQGGDAQEVLKMLRTAS